MVCVASFLDLCVAAAGIPSSGGHPCPGLLPLLDLGLHHSCVQDECTDHGCHSSLGSWGCVCLHLLTEEGRGNLNIYHKLGVMLFSAGLFAWFLYLTHHSSRATRPGLCCAATMLWTGIITSTLLMGSMCLLLVSFTCVRSCVCVCVCMRIIYRPNIIFDPTLRPPPFGNNCDGCWIYWQRQQVRQLWCQVCHSNRLHHTFVLLYWYGNCQVSTLK